MPKSLSWKVTSFLTSEREPQRMQKSGRGSGVPSESIRMVTIFFLGHRESLLVSTRTGAIHQPNRTSPSNSVQVVCLSVLSVAFFVKYVMLRVELLADKTDRLTEFVELEHAISDKRDAV